jgi:hypothetical protein
MTEAATGGLTANTYRSYLVRFWQSHEQGSWRASAQCVQTGNTVLFGDVASLFAFLQTEIGVSASEDEPASARTPAYQV